MSGIERSIRRCVASSAAAALWLLPAVAQDIEAGREIYWRYCSSCHGEEADGHGPMRPVLTVPPKDLTKLSAESGGVFPVTRVIRRIDGRDPLVSHGSEMPVYGDFFNEGSLVQVRTETGETIVVGEAIADLLAYLQTIQAK